MTANEFWSHLEYRVCREIDGLRAADYRGWWCAALERAAEDFVGSATE